MTALRKMTTTLGCGLSLGTCQVLTLSCIKKQIKLKTVRKNKRSSCLAWEIHPYTFSIQASLIATSTYHKTLQAIKQNKQTNKTDFK